MQRARQSVWRLAALPAASSRIGHEARITQLDEVELRREKCAAGFRSEADRKARSRQLDDGRLNCRAVSAALSRRHRRGNGVQRVVPEARIRGIIEWVAGGLLVRIQEGLEARNVAR